MTQKRRICMAKQLSAGILALVAVLPIGRLYAEDLQSLRYTKTVQAIREAEPAVVNIEGNKPASGASAARGDAQQVNGMGAGVIIDERGFILTNQHVVQDVGRIEVTLHNGRQYVGKLIARDPETDLALVKIESRTSLPVIRCGTSSDLMRGEPVIAIGNPFGYHHTVTRGIISALHRDIPVNGVQDYPDLIQTDASINPGNSGGPLLNADGKMIGINAAVRIGAQGIGFAIPVDRATEVAADMIAQYRGADATLQVRTAFKDGKTSLKVVRGNGDVKSGDIISRVNDQVVANRLQYELALIGARSLDLELDRGGSSEQTTLALRSRTPSRTRLASTNTIDDQVYRKFGFRLEPASPTDVRRIDASYKGGLRVTSVRQNSPAFEAQIQTGDVLVGLMEWQTPDWEDLNWIMRSSEMRTAANPKFHIMRDSEVFWGTLDLKGGTLR